MNYVRRTSRSWNKAVGFVGRRRIWIVGLALIALLAILGMFLWVKNEYLAEIKIVEVNNKVAHFSLSYPNRYNRVGPRVTPQGLCYLSLPANRANISIAAPDPYKTGSVSVSHVPASIEVAVYDVNAYRPVDGRNARAQLEFILGRQSEEPEFELLDRSTTVVSGIVAEQATWRAPNPLPFKGLPNRLVRQIYFDRGGYVWEISFFSEESLEEIIAADFEYVLSTFEILD